MVVVGAGLAGLVSASLLLDAGFEVTVLESRHTGSVTTGNSLGVLSLLQGTNLGQIRKHAGDEVLQAYAESNRFGQKWLLQKLSHLGVPVDRRDAFTYVPDSVGEGELMEELEASNLAGIPAHEVLETGLPFAVRAALILENQAELHPLKMLESLADDLRSKGAKIVEGARVIGIETENEGVSLISTRGVMMADYCILATGSPILDEGPFFARMHSLRSYVAAFRLYGSKPPRGMFFAAGSHPRSIRTANNLTGEEVLIVGGGAHITGRSKQTRAELNSLDDWTNINIGTAERISWWAAQDYRTPTRVPFAGRLSWGDDRLFAATGFNNWGYSNAVAAAHIIKAELLGEDLDWAHPLRDHNLRFADIRDGVTLNLSAAGRMLSGWLGGELTPASRADKLAEGEGLVVREGTSLVGVARINGRLLRVSPYCTHLGGVLTWNEAERSWDCPLHGSRYDAYGTVLEGSATLDLESQDF